MSLYYIETTFGCGLRQDSASEIRKSVGTENLKSIRKATAKDVQWVAGMGGHVPPAGKKYLTEKSA